MFDSLMKIGQRRRNLALQFGFQRLQSVGSAKPVEISHACPLVRYFLISVILRARVNCRLTLIQQLFLIQRMGDLADSNSEKPAAKPLPRPIAAKLTSAFRPEIAAVLDQTRKLAVDIDEIRVQRSFRNWLDWIKSRATNDPISIAVVADAGFAAAAPQAFAAINAVGDSVVELRDARIGGRASPHWTTIEHDLKSPYRMVILRHPADLANDWRLCGMLRRECVGLLHFDEEIPNELPGGLFDDSPIGVVRLWREAPAGAREPGRIPVGADNSIAQLLAAAVPPNIVEPLRARVLARDLLDLAVELQREEAGVLVKSDESATSASARAGRGEEERLTQQIEAVAAVRVEVATELKEVIAALRIERSSIDSAKLFATPPEAFATLVERLESSKEADLTDLVVEHDKRNWWSTGVLRHMPVFFASKKEIQLRPEALQGVLRESEAITLREVGRTTSRAVSNFNAALTDLDQTFETLSPTATTVIRNHLLERTFRDSFLPRAPSSGQQDSQIAIQVREAISRTFAGFADGEVRNFRVEREHKGLLGRITEARAAIFGIYFLMLMSTRLITPEAFCPKPPARAVISAQADQPRPTATLDLTGNSAAAAQPAPEAPRRVSLSCRAARALSDRQWLVWILVSLIIVGFLFNLLTLPLRDQIKFVDRVEGKLEELHGRLSAFIDRQIKDQLGAVEAWLSAQAEALDGELGAMHATLRARVEALRAASASAAPREGLVLARPSTVEAAARKLAAGVDEAFAAEYAQATR